MLFFRYEPPLIAESRLQLTKSVGEKIVYVDNLFLHCVCKYRSREGEM